MKGSTGSAAKLSLIEPLWASRVAIVGAELLATVLHNSDECGCLIEAH